MSQLTKFGESIQLTSETIKQYLCNKATDQEAMMFFEICKMHNLNPFAGDANLVKYGTSPAQPIVTEKAWNRKLNEIKELEGVEDGIIVKTKDGQIIERQGEFYDDGETLAGGWCTVKIKDRLPVVTKIRLSDYNKSQAMWKQIAARMICKTARVQAIRKAIPDMSGLYIAEEMDGVNGTDNKQVINITPKDSDIERYKIRIESAKTAEEIKYEIGKEILELFDGKELEELRIMAAKKMAEIK